ncbi:MAG: hypothetical protein FWG87_05145 [Defluviitaleaceae bacterium]|nr:hypothetical protein [Defluviitaleaceae bacterium]
MRFTCRGRIYPSRGTPLVNLGQVTSINAERGNLGTDKSVPYKKHDNRTKSKCVN